MSERDTLTVLLEEIGTAFAPLGEALESFENFELYARELGWSVTSIPPALQALASCVGYLAHPRRFLVQTASKSGIVCDPQSIKQKPHPMGGATLML